MKALRLSLAALTAALISYTPAFGQRVEAQPIQIQPVRGGEAPLLTPDAVEKLKFTNEQKEKYTKIDADYRDKAKAAQDKFRADIQGVRDREKYKEAQEKMATDTKKAREDQLAKIEPLLSAEQKTVFAQVKQQAPQPGAIGGGVRPLPIGGAGINPVLPPAVQNRLQLTDEQKKEIEKIQKEVEAKIMKVLTDEQRKQLEQFKKGPAIRPIQPVPPVQRIQPVPPVRRNIEVDNTKPRRE